jgi:hypothetical protein
MAKPLPPAEMAELMIRTVLPVTAA